MEGTSESFGAGEGDQTAMEVANELQGTAEGPLIMFGLDAHGLLSRNRHLTELEQGTSKEYSEIKGDGATLPPLPSARSATHYAYHDQEGIQHLWFVPDDRWNNRHPTDTEQGTTAAFPEVAGDGAVQTDLENVDLATVVTARLASRLPQRRNREPSSSGRWIGTQWRKPTTRETRAAGTARSSAATDALLWPHWT